MKKIVSALLSVVFVVAFSGCDSPDSSGGTGRFTLKVTTSSWSGEEYYTPEEETYEYVLDVPGTIRVPPDQDTGVSVRIIELFDNGITFEMDQAMSPYGGGINLMTDQTVFTIYAGQTLSLVTPSMDAGEIYIFELIWGLARTEDHP